MADCGPDLVVGLWGVSCESKANLNDSFIFMADKQVANL